VTTRVTKSEDPFGVWPMIQRATKPAPETAAEHPKGSRVYSRTGTTYGIITGYSKCQLEGCSGTRVWVQWKSGKLTKPCSEGLKTRRGRAQIA
jgi:hypothetical protein